MAEPDQSIIFIFQCFVLQSVTCKPHESINDSKLHSENMEKQQDVGPCKDPPQSQPQESSIIDGNFIPPPPSLGTS